VTPVALDDRVAAFVSRRFGGDARLARLAGDASDRVFYRVHPASLSPLILMVHPEPFELEALPFFQHARFLHDIGAAVPQVVASYPHEGILVVQDLGDQRLQEHLAGCDAGRRRFLYMQAVQMIAFLQDDGTRALHADLPASRTALDVDRLTFEMRFFLEHYAGTFIGSLGGAPLTAEEAASLEGWLLSLAREVASYRRVLCHRDFHSRNLMVKGERLYMLDFQDARMGAYTYDLASLLRDSYVELPEHLVVELIEFFREVSHLPEGESSFTTAFTQTSLQRNIKALGTFASQAVLRGNTSYLEHIPRTLAHIRANLERESNAAMLRLFEGPLDYRP